SPCWLNIPLSLFARRRDLPVPPAVDLVHLMNPACPLLMRQAENFLMAPAQPDGDKGYLLVQAFEGVAYNSPSRGVSTSCSCPQLGHTTCMCCGSTSLISRYRFCR